MTDKRSYLWSPGQSSVTSIEVGGNGESQTWSVSVRRLVSTVMQRGDSTREEGLSESFFVWYAVDMEPFQDMSTGNRDKCL